MSNWRLFPHLHLPVWIAGIHVALVVLMLSMASASGQVGVSLRVDRQRYLRYEPVNATVTLRNYSGNSLVFGKGEELQGSITFEITDPYGRDIDAFDQELNFAENLILAPGETRALRLVLNNYYNLQKPGHYRIAARVGHRRMRKDVRSDDIMVDIKKGTLVWSKQIGIPNADPAGDIRSRQVSLLIFETDDVDRYCLLVEDAKQVYGVIRLGRRILGAEPSYDVDAMSNIHILIQNQPRLYRYRVYNYNAELRQEEYYIVEKTIPRLVRDPEVGRVSVEGGREAVAGVDYFPKTQGKRTRQW